MDMKKMMKQAQKMQAQLAHAQNEVAEMTFESCAGGGMVCAVAKGDMSLESIRIKPEVLEAADAELLEDMVLSAVNEALKGVSEKGASHLSGITGGMNIPGLM